MNFQHFSIVIACLSVFTTAIKADTIYYPNTESPELFFSDITESSLDPLPLFGAPAISENNLMFENPTFLTQTANNVDFIDGRMTVTVTSKTNQKIASLNLIEEGEYEIQGQGLVSVSGIAFAIANGKIYQGEFQFDTNQTGANKWTQSIDIAFDEPVYTFSLVLDNQLFGNSDEQSFTSVSKSNVRLQINNSNIPEPSATLAVLAFLTITLKRRRS